MPPASDPSASAERRQQQRSSSSSAPASSASNTKSSGAAAALLLLEDEVRVPRSLADALDEDDVQRALHLYAERSLAKADELSAELSRELAGMTLPLPELLVLIMNSNASNENKEEDSDNNNNNNSNLLLSTAGACSDSIYHSLRKIASGGSQASQEIRQLEHEKRDLDDDAAAVAHALELRQQAQDAVKSLQAEAWHAAAQAVRPYLEWKQQLQKRQEQEQQQGADGGGGGDDTDEEERERLRWSVARVREYVGEYALQQLERAQSELQERVLGLYQQAVQSQDLAQLGTLTPVLSTIHLEAQALSLYLQFLKQTLQAKLQQEAAAAAATPANNKNQQQQQQQQQQQLPFVRMARVYNAAVQCLRHHLPLVSHCLHSVQGDAAVVQLVHVSVEQSVLPLLEEYEHDKQLRRVSRAAARIAAALEDRYGGSHQLSDNDPGPGGPTDDDDPGGNWHEEPDCGFARALGSLSDVDAAMEEAALCLQHAESYLRFVQHTCAEVNGARRIRMQREREQQRLEKERQEWHRTAGRKQHQHHPDHHLRQDPHQDLQILPPFTPLHQAVAELGGQYAGIEHCLVLASMHRAFCMLDEVEDGANPGGSGDSATSAALRMYYRPLSLTTSTGVAAEAALQTAVVDTCLFATRRSAQRAFATGHTGTASAVTNFAVDCLQGVLLEVLSQHAEELGVARLKPGEGLLVGSAGIFNTLRDRSAVVGAVGVGGMSKNPKDEVLKRQQVSENTARACAVLNDLEVAVHHVRQLEALLTDTTARGFPPGSHDTEQLFLCVKSLQNVTDSFHVASNAAVESLESVLRPRIRAIVGEAVGTTEGTMVSSGVTSATGFMAASSVVTSMGGGKAMAAADRIGGGTSGGAGAGAGSRMNYHLDDDTYNLQQLSEGYVVRLCTLLDELLNPLRTYLAPRLWDKLLLDVLGTVSKRLEHLLRSKCKFTSLGALALDSDMRDLLGYAKDRLHSSDFSSNVAVTRACVPLARLLQIAKLLNVDDLDDVLDLISSSKRKNQWELKLDDTKALLSARVEFEAEKVNELLRLPDDD